LEKQIIIMKRVQRKRTKGYKLPPNTKYVGRPTKWGNPFKLDPEGYIMIKNINKNIIDTYIYWSATSGFEIEDICFLYKKWILGELEYNILPKPPDINELIGYDNLSCFCPLSKPCHADVLIEILNEKK